jgi:hypothetical protein
MSTNWIGRIVLFGTGCGLALLPDPKVRANTPPLRETVESIQFWDSATLKAGRRFETTRTGPGSPVSFGPASIDPRGARIVASQAIWSGAEGPGMPAPGFAGLRTDPGRIGFRADGGVVAAASDGIWEVDFQAGRKERLLAGSFQRLEISANASHALAQASEHDEVHVHAIPDGTVLGRFASAPNAIWSIAPTGDHVAIAETDSNNRWTVRVVAFQPDRVVGERAGWPPLAWAPDGKILAMRSGNDSVDLWNLATGSSTSQAHGHVELTALAFMPDGGLVTAGQRQAWSETGELRVWDGKVGKLLIKVETAGRVRNLAVTADGKTVIGVIHEDRNIPGSSGSCGASPTPPPRGDFGGLPGRIATGDGAGTADSAVQEDSTARTAWRAMVGFGLVIGVVLAAYLVRRIFVGTVRTD